MTVTVEFINYRPLTIYVWINNEYDSFHIPSGDTATKTFPKNAMLNLSTGSAINTRVAFTDGTQDYQDYTLQHDVTLIIFRLIGE